MAARRRRPRRRPKSRPWRQRAVAWVRARALVRLMIFLGLLILIYLTLWIGLVLPQYYIAWR